MGRPSIDGLDIGRSAHSTCILHAEGRAALVGMGVLLGVPGAVLLTRLVSSVLAGGSANVPIEMSMISEVSYLHPTTYVWIASLLTVIALTACLAPARRAAKLDPMQVLRHE